MIYNIILGIWSRIKEGIVFSFPLYLRMERCEKLCMQRERKQQREKLMGEKEVSIYHTKEEKRRHVGIHDISFFYYLLNAYGKDE